MSTGLPLSPSSAPRKRLRPIGWGFLPIDHIPCRTTEWHRLFSRTCWNSMNRTSLDVGFTSWFHTVPWSRHGTRESKVIWSVWYSLIFWAFFPTSVTQHGGCILPRAEVHMLPQGARAPWETRIMGIMDHHGYPWITDRPSPKALPIGSDCETQRRPWQLATSKWCYPSPASQRLPETPKTPFLAETISNWKMSERNCVRKCWHSSLGPSKM